MLHPFLRTLRRCGGLVLSLVVAACGGGGSGGVSGGTPPQTTFSVGGTVSGLKGSGLRLQINQSEALSVADNGTFRFQTAVATGTSYSIAVLSNPIQPVQGCVVSKGQGQVGAADVTDVAITCDTAIIQGIAERVASAGNRPSEALLLITEFVGLRLSYLKAHLAASVREPCSLPGATPVGSSTAAFSDRDNNGALSEGDVVTFTLDGCTASSLSSSLVSGQIVLTLGPPPQPATYREGFSADITSVSFDVNNTRLTGTFHAVFTDTDELRVLEASVSNSALDVTSVYFVPSDVVTLVNATISKRVDYAAARYEVRAQGQFDSNRLQARYSFATPTPLSGWFNTMPDTGSLQLSAGRSVLTLPANGSDRNATIDAMVDPDGSGKTTSIPGMPWGSVSTGLLWATGRRAATFGTPFFGANELILWRFQFTDAAPFADPANYGFGENLPVGTTFKLYFSGPVDGTRTKFSFVPESSDAAVTIPADLQINGAVVIAKPRQQLEHGMSYRLRADDAGIFTTLRTAAGSFPNPLSFTTSNNLQADGHASPAVASPGQAVTFESTRSFSANSRIVDVSWRQTAGTAVQIDNAGTATPGFVVPAGAANGEALKFELTVKDANGETDTIGVTAFVLSDLTQPFYYRRFAQGALTGLIPETARLRWAGTGQVTVRFITLWQFSFLLDTSVPGESDMLDLFGYPDLQPGTYTLSTQNRVMTPLQAGCNDPLGQIVVREIQRGPSLEVVRFAADYEVYCTNAHPRQIGSVRVNSTVPLP